MGLTIFHFLKPQLPAEGFPRWAWLTTPELARICGVSQQSIYNWRLRGTGPPSVQDESGRHFVRLADALSWMNRGAESPAMIIAEWITKHFPGVLEWSQKQAAGQEGPEAALTHAIEFLEVNGLVPRTRKPGRPFTPKFARAA